jgi:hypothetical protein
MTSVSAQKLTLPQAPGNYIEKISYTEITTNYSEVDSGTYVTFFEEYRTEYTKESQVVTKYLLTDSTVVTLTQYQDSLFHNNSFGNPAFTYADKFGYYTYDVDSLLIDSLRYLDIDSNYSPPKLGTLFYSMQFPDSLELVELVNAGWSYEWLASGVLKLDSADVTFIQDSIRARFVTHFDTTTSEYTQFITVNSCGYYPSWKMYQATSEYLYGFGFQRTIKEYSNHTSECPGLSPLTNLKNYEDKLGQKWVSLVVNPVDNALNLKIEETGPSSLRVKWLILDLAGKALANGSFAKTAGRAFIIDIASLNIQPGMYFLRLSYGGRFEVLPFVKQ